MTDLRTAATQALEFIRWSQFIPSNYGDFPEPPTTAPLVEAALVAALGAPVEKTTGNLVHIKLNIMRTALENIAGIRPIVNNLLSDKDIARIALERIDRYEHPISKRPPP